MKMGEMRRFAVGVVSLALVLVQTTGQVMAVMPTQQEQALRAIRQEQAHPLLRGVFNYGAQRHSPRPKFQDVPPSPTKPAQISLVSGKK